MKPYYAILAIAALSAAYAGARPVPAAANSTAADTTENADSALIVIESVSDYFLFSNEFDVIDQTNRMDMLDYYASGKKKQMPSRLGGKVSIDSIAGNHYMKVITSDASETEVRMYTLKSGDKFFSIINRVNLPATDSRLRFDLADEAKIFPTQPTTEDFLNGNKKQKAEIAEKVDFPLIDYTFLPNGDIEARLTLSKYISREDSAVVMPRVKDKIVYHWNGKSFSQAK